MQSRFQLAIATLVRQMGHKLNAPRKPLWFTCKSWAGALVVEMGGRHLEWTWTPTVLEPGELVCFRVYLQQQVSHSLKSKRTSHAVRCAPTLGSCLQRQNAEAKERQRGEESVCQGGGRQKLPSFSPRTWLAVPFVVNIVSRRTRCSVQASETCTSGSRHSLVHYSRMRTVAK